MYFCYNELAFDGIKSWKLSEREKFAQMLVQIDCTTINTGIKLNVFRFEYEVSYNCRFLSMLYSLHHMEKESRSQYRNCDHPDSKLESIIPYKLLIDLSDIYRISIVILSGNSDLVK